VKEFCQSSDENQMSCFLGDTVYVHVSLPISTIASLVHG